MDGKKKFKAISLKNLDDETISNIRIWRNQDFVRKNMLQQHIITEEEHNRYINSLENNSERGLYVFYLDDVPFGVYQYQFNSQTKEITNGCYLICEEDQEYGYGTIMCYMMGWIQCNIVGAKIVNDVIISYNKNALAIKKRTNSVAYRIEKNIENEGGEPYDLYYYHEKALVPDKDSRFAKAVFNIIAEEFEVIG